MSNAARDLTTEQVQHLVAGEQYLVIPADGLAVMDPEARGPSHVVKLPADGRMVKWTSYWHRRFRDADVRVQLPSAPVVEKPKSKPAEG